MAWYYHLNGANEGPFETAELENLFRQNKIALETPVWTEGMAEWAPYRTSVAMSPALAQGPVQVCAECGRRFPETEMVHYENSWICAGCKPLFFQRIKEGLAPKSTLIFASVGQRFVAILVDALIVDTVVLLPIFLIFGMQGFLHKTAYPIVNVSLIILQYLAPALYEILLIGAYGATLGKMLMKVKVVDASGAPISYGRSTGRYFAKMLSGIILGIGYLMAIWDDEKRALHDRLCKTRVIRNP